MNKVRVVLVVVFVLIIGLSIGCYDPKGIPNATDAKFEIRSEQSAIGMPIYTNDYRIEDGVLYIENGHYDFETGSIFPENGHYDFETGSIFSPVYRFYEGDLIFTQFSIKVRK